MRVPDYHHATEWQKLQAAEAPGEEDYDSLEHLRSIPKDRTTGHETAVNRSNYVSEANYAINNRRKMRRPVPIWTRLLPALQLKPMKHRALACRSLLGVFPVHYRYLSSIGLHMYLDDLRRLSQKKMTNLEL